MSWVPRAQRHLFADIRFGSGGSSIQSWIAAFPDPSSSPAHYTRRLRIFDCDIAAVATWIHPFRHIVELRVKPLSRSRSVPTSLAQLRGLSPTLRSLYIYTSYIPHLDLLGFICSFPLVEDLNLQYVTATGGIDNRSIDLASPKFTGNLYILSVDSSAARGLLALPCGLRFTKIIINSVRAAGYAGLVNDLVSKCSGTLEFLKVSPPYQRTFPSTPMVNRCLFIANGRVDAAVF